MYKYNVYKNENLLVEGLGRQELTKFTGISRGGLDYLLDQIVNDEDRVSYKGYEIERHLCEDSKISNLGITAKHIKEWNNMMMAAELLRQGQGRIVTKIINGKKVKVTVPNGVCV